MIASGLPLQGDYELDRNYRVRLPSRIHLLKCSDNCFHKGRQIIGALSVDKPYDPRYSLIKAEKLLSVVATMVARHVINLETIRLEKQTLRDENKRLLSELENKYRITNIVGNSNQA